MRERTIIGLLVLALAALGAMGLRFWASRQSAPSVTELSLHRPVESPSGGILGQFSPLDPPRPAPALTFEGRDGSPRSLSEFQGRWVLVNLWATWCGPCVREMPSLDRLQEKLGNRLTVLAISEDRGAAHVVDPFLEKLGIKNLAIYFDPKSTVGQALGIGGLPTSFLIDGEGSIIGRLEGPAEWDSVAIVSKLETYIGGAKNGSPRS